MFVLSTTWAALAKASGRFDPWPVLAALSPEQLERPDRATLQRAGVPLDVLAECLSGQPVHSPFPFLLAGGMGYPAALASLPFAPPVLFYEGDLAALALPGVAIVGSRSCTSEGRRTAAELARAVCLAGGCVVSGMAIGIDTAAHREAMLHGRTIAVLGQGLAANSAQGAQRLRREIVAAGGIILAEFPPTYPAQKHTFLQRNRVIAGLSRATVVVEAGRRSGALNTARHALEAGREVLAVPGHYRASCSEGCLGLIEQGAGVVRSPAGVVEAAGLTLAASRERELPSGARILEEALRQGGTVEQLAHWAGVPVVEACRLLLELELAGLVRRRPGQRYERP